MNLHRRHLTQSQRSRAIHRLETLTHGNQARFFQDALNASWAAKTREQLAKENGVSVRGIAQAAELERLAQSGKIRPKLVDSVDNGRLSLTYVLDKIGPLSLAEQDKLLASNFRHKINPVPPKPRKGGGSRLTLERAWAVSSEEQKIKFYDTLVVPWNRGRSP
jgi:hypothetical protein